MTVSSLPPAHLSTDTRSYGHCYPVEDTVADEDNCTDEDEYCF